MSKVRCFLSIDCRTRMVKRYVDGKKANIAKLPAYLNAWTLAELETFRAYGPPAVPYDPTPQTS